MAHAYNPRSVDTEVGRFLWFWSHSRLYGVFWISLGYGVRTCLFFTIIIKASQANSQKRSRCQIDARPAFIPSLIIVFLIQLRSSCTWKNEVLPPSKLSLFNNSEDQQKNPSSFANVSWYPVKSGHHCRAWRALWFVCNSLFPCNSLWGVSGFSIITSVAVTFGPNKTHRELSQIFINWETYWLKEGPVLLMSCFKLEKR